MKFEPHSSGRPVRDPQLLRMAREAAHLPMGQVFAAVVARIDDALFDRAEVAGASQMLYLDAMRELRRRRQEVVSRFNDHLQTAWTCMEAGAPLSAEQVLSGEMQGALSLVPEHVLESRLAVRNVASVLMRDWKPVLSRLDGRLGWIAGGQELNADTNPIGPEHMGVALHEAFSTSDMAPEVRLVVIKLCERELLGPIGSMYEALDTKLAQAGVMPEVPRQPAARPAPRRSPGAAAENAAEREAGAGEQEGADDMPGWAQQFIDRWSDDHGRPPANAHYAGGQGGEPLTSEGQAALLGALEELLAQNRHSREGMNQPASTSAGQQRPLSQSEMMSVLSLLQATPSATLRAAVGDDGESLGQRLKSEVLSGATRLGVDPSSARLDPQDEDAIDLVGMLFDVMLDERELEGGARDLIAKLVVPFVKVALLDRRMFVQKTHPARKLLNSLAEACEGNTGESPAERVLMGKVEEIVERLIAEFNENLAIFLTLEEEFREFLAQHRRRIEIAERRAAETQRGQEKLELARARAATELAQRVGADEELPQSIGEFLRQPWGHHLTLAILREGDDGQGVRDSLALADALVAEVAQAKARMSGKRWLQDHESGLKKVFASVGVHGDGSDAAIAALRDTLTAIAELRPELERALPELPAIALPSAPPAETPVLEFGGPQPEEGFDNAEVERFRIMEVGTWMDFIDKEGKLQAGKLSWVSPISKRLLFVNRRGVRFCVASPEELAVMARLGRLRPHVDDSAFDSALHEVIERLEPRNTTLH
jgi:hypothetical protein